MNNKYMNESIAEMTREIQKQTENKLLEQLNDFISRGLIEVESTQPVLIQDQWSAKVSVQMSINLRLKDKEYIERLEKENEAFKKAFVELKGIIK